MLPAFNNILLYDFVGFFINFCAWPLLGAAPRYLSCRSFWAAETCRFVGQHEARVINGVCGGQPSSDSLPIVQPYNAVGSLLSSFTDPAGRGNAIGHSSMTPLTRCTLYVNSADCCNVVYAKTWVSLYLYKSVWSESYQRHGVFDILALYKI